MLEGEDIMDNDDKGVFRNPQKQGAILTLGLTRGG
jgi:hypothetical protein